VGSARHISSAQQGMDAIQSSYAESWASLEQRRADGTQHWEAEPCVIPNHPSSLTTPPTEHRRPQSGRPHPARCALVCRTRRGLLLCGNIFYFATLGFLYLWMRERDPYNPRLFMQFYNLSCVVLAGISGVRSQRLSLPLVCS
jgi:hypothetical protein